MMKKNLFFAFVSIRTLQILTNFLEKQNIKC